jgi:hypothetical protein
MFFSISNYCIYNKRIKTKALICIEKKLYYDKNVTYLTIFLKDLAKIKSKFFG